MMLKELDIISSQERCEMHHNHSSLSLQEI